MSVWKWTNYEKHADIDHIHHMTPETIQYWTHGQDGSSVKKRDIVSTQVQLLNVQMWES